MGITAVGDLAVKADGVCTRPNREATAPHRLTAVPPLPPLVQVTRIDRGDLRVTRRPEGRDWCWEENLQQSLTRW